MAEVRVAHTAGLDAAVLAAARALLYDVFDDMTDHDWEHALGGMHALVWEGADLIGHASVVRGGYELGALGAADTAAAFYADRGWMLWRGPSSALTPTGIRRTREDDGCIYVLPAAAPLDPLGELTCDWRDGDLW